MSNLEQGTGKRKQGQRSRVSNQRRGLLHLLGGAGVNHCRLAKFRGLMYQVFMMGACDFAGEFALLCGPSLNLQVVGVYQPITGLYFPMYSEPRNFAKRQCKLQWLTPPSLRLRVLGSGSSGSPGLNTGRHVLWVQTSWVSQV